MEDWVNKMLQDATIILYDKDKKVLLQHRTNDAKRFPSMWGLFGGGIKKGETPIEAIKRECMEELDYELINPSLVYTTHTGRRKVYAFIEEYNPLKKLVLREGKKIGWFKIKEAKKIKIAPHARRILNKIEDTINKQT